VRVYDPLSPYCTTVQTVQSKQRASGYAGSQKTAVVVALP
jgi:hypothetical protein